jgi:pterin-4a-carbinolamine dehydratase
MNKVTNIAIKLNHHPMITLDFTSVELSTTTHSAGSKVTEKDKELTKLVDETFNENA